MQLNQTNRLFDLPSNLLSYIYSFDPTFRNQIKTTEFHLELLDTSGEGHRIIYEYLQEFFSESYIWINEYGVFTKAENFTMKNMKVYKEYKLITYLDMEKNRICFDLLPPTKNCFKPIVSKRCDGFLTNNGECNDNTYLGVQTNRLGKLTYLYVDDI
jgi:hypothetical protein